MSCGTCDLSGITFSLRTLLAKGQASFEFSVVTIYFLSLAGTGNFGGGTDTQLLTASTKDVSPILGKTPFGYKYDGFMGFPQRGGQNAWSFI